MEALTNRRALASSDESQMLPGRYRPCVGMPYPRDRTASTLHWRALHATAKPFETFSAAVDHCVWSASSIGARRAAVRLVVRTQTTCAACIRGGLSLRGQH